MGNMRVGGVFVILPINTGAGQKNTRCADGKHAVTGIDRQEITSKAEESAVHESEGGSGKSEFHAVERYAYVARMMEKELDEKERLSRRGRFVVGSVSGIVALLGVATTFLFQVNKSESLGIVIPPIFAASIGIVPGLMFAIASVISYLEHQEEDHGTLVAKPEFDEVVGKWFRTQPSVLSVEPRSLMTAVTYDNHAYKAFVCMCEKQHQRNKDADEIGSKDPIDDVPEGILGAIRYRRPIFREMIKEFRDVVIVTLRSELVVAEGQASRKGGAACETPGSEDSSSQSDKLLEAAKNARSAIDSLFRVIDCHVPIMPEEMVGREDVDEFVAQLEAERKKPRRLRSAQRANLFCALMLLLFKEQMFGNYEQRELDDDDKPDDRWGALGSKWSELNSEFFRFADLVAGNGKQELCGIQNKHRQNWSIWNTELKFRWHPVFAIFTGRRYVPVRRMFRRVWPTYALKKSEPVLHGIRDFAWRKEIAAPGQFGKEERIDRSQKVLASIANIAKHMEVLISESDNLFIYINSPTILVQSNTYYLQIKEWECIDSGGIPLREPAVRHGKSTGENNTHVLKYKDRNWRRLASEYFAAQEQRSANWNLWWRVRIAEMRFIQSLRCIAAGLVMGVAVLMITGAFNVMKPAAQGPTTEGKGAAEYQIDESRAD